MAKAKVQYYEYTVEGTLFPYDMLRYDACYPAHEAESHKLDQLYGRPERRQIVIRSNIKPPTEARWNSFGWKIVSPVREVKF